MRRRRRRLPCDKTSRRRKLFFASPRKAISGPRSALSALHPRVHNRLISATRPCWSNVSIGRFRSFDDQRILQLLRLEVPAPAGEGQRARREGLASLHANWHCQPNSVIQGVCGAAFRRARIWYADTRTDDATEPQPPKLVSGLSQMDRARRCVHARRNQILFIITVHYI